MAIFERIDQPEATFGPQTNRWNEIAVENQSMTVQEGPRRVNGADGSYSYTYANGDSITYNSQNEVQSAVINGTTYTRFAPGLYHLSTDNVGQGTRLGHFERTPHGIRFIPAPVDPMLQPPGP